jgi:transposase
LNESGSRSVAKEVVVSVKKFIVDLSERERQLCQEVVKKLKGTGQKVRRASILLKADCGWSDAKIGEALGCSTKTVENVRKRFVECGFEETLDRKPRQSPPTAKLLDGEQEAKIIAMRLGDPPKGFGKWTLRLLARKVVELEIAPTVSYQTVRRTLKKQNEHQPEPGVLGHPTGSQRRIRRSHGRRFGRLFKAIRRPSAYAVHG